MQTILMAFCKGVMVGFWFLAAVLMLPFAVAGTVLAILFGERNGHF